ncbi:MAG: hypothetical protein RLZZ303_2859 [Candidatus Hydrogenedentota bacterium]|jgi:hypothetical protein
MRVLRSVDLDCSFEQCLEALRRPRLMLHVAAPLVTMIPVEPTALPELWEERDYTVSLRLFGLIPLGRQTIVIRMVEVTPDRAELRDEGRGQLAKRWLHVIRVERTGAGCRYTDDISVEAGLITPVAWMFTHLLFWHRQRRWRALAASGAFERVGLGGA